MKRYFLLFLILSLLFFGKAGIAYAQTITTIAGKPGISIQVSADNKKPPTSAEIGDEGKADTANLKEPTSIVTDLSGNIYFIDAGYYRVRKISANGIITTIAGNGKLGKSKDKIPATKAEMEPSGMAVDSKGNLYISDASNHKVRKIDPAGMITTIAGTGKSGFSGDGGAAVLAQLTNPYNIAVDVKGNIFIADAGNNRIRKINPDGIITTIAGNGDSGSSGDGAQAIEAGIDFPYGLSVDNAGNIYFTESNYNKVRKISTNGIIDTYAGNGTAALLGDGGPATNASLNSPQGVALDASGNVYVAERDNSVIRKITPSGIISTIAGTGTKGYEGDGGNAVFAKLNNPSGIAIDAHGNIYITDQGNNCIRKISIK